MQPPLLTSPPSGGEEYEKAAKALLPSTALFRRDRHARRRHVGIVVVAEIDLLARDGMDVAQERLQVAADHRLGERVLDLAVLDVERVLGDAAEVEVAVGIAAREARQDDAAPGAGDDLVEVLVARRHDEVPHTGGLREPELVRDVEVDEMVLEPPVLDDVDVARGNAEAVEVAAFGKGCTARSVQETEQRACDHLAFL